MVVYPTLDLGEVLRHGTMNQEAKACMECASLRRTTTLRDQCALKGSE